MSDAATLAPPAPAAAPAAPAAPAPAPTTAAAPAAPAAPAAAPAPAFESLIHGEAPAAPAAPGAAPAPAAADPFAGLLAKVPEKFHVKQGDALDTAASLAKALEHREHLEKRLGAGDLPPKTAAEYAFTPPPELKDFEFKTGRIDQFREGFHKLGGTQEMYQYVMSQYIDAVPDLMEGAAKMTATEARAELQKVWPVTTDYEAGIGNAQRALRGLPPELQEATREFGTDPAFLRVLAHFGTQMREDRPPGAGGAPLPAGDINQLMASKAYTDPKDPNHAAVSKQVRDYYARAHGTQPI